MRIEASQTFRVSAERLWPLLANTDSLNRELGLPNVEYTFTPHAHGGTAVRAKAKMGPVRMEWDEHPFEWIWPREYSVRRVFHKGPVKLFHATFHFEPSAEGCTVSIGLDLEASKFLAKPLVGRIGKRSVDHTLKAARNFERFLLGEIPSPYPNRHGRAKVDRAELAGRLHHLSEMPVNRGLAARLGNFVADEVDERVCELRPYELAEEWKVDRHELLKLCLYATRSGLLDLRWHVICPS